MQLTVDLVVLATGMVPNSADGPAIRALARRQCQGPPQRVRGSASKRRRKSLRNSSPTRARTSCLDVSSGSGSARASDGFPDSQFVCFPYESFRTGIYAAGRVRAPMDSAWREDAGGRHAEGDPEHRVASHGQAVHPRAGDFSSPSFFLQRCTQCKRCTEECPFGSLDEDEKGTPKFNADRCRRCGICMGACPERIISFKNYSVDMIARMIKAIEVPDETEEKPRILVLACENDAYPALDLAGRTMPVTTPACASFPCAAWAP